MWQIDLNVSDVSAWIPGVSSELHWQAWLEGRLDPLQESDTVLADFPPMLRRRLGSSGKSAVHCLLALGEHKEQYPDVPVIFCSHYGEVSRSVKLLKAIAEERALSPADFSLSVHNAVAGVYSIGMGLKGNITAISAGENGVVATLIEAYGVLCEAIHPRVLCVLYDNPLPAPYSDRSECQFPYAFAFWISRPQATPAAFPLRLSAIDSIRQNPEGANAGISKIEAIPVSFLKFLLQPRIASIDLTCRCSHWHCERLSDVQPA